MKFGIVINVYIAEDENVYHTYDHPTYLNNFDDGETLSKTIESIEHLNGINDYVKLYLFGIDVSRSIKNDNIIKQRIEQIMEGGKYEYEIITNSEILEKNNEYNSDFFRIDNYSTARNQGLLFALMDNIDYLIQIDDDEILRSDYLVKLKSIIIENGDKYILTAPYEKNGTVMITAEDKLKSWKKFESMNNDMIRLMKDHSIKESLFGFGGNMIIHKSVFETIFYPEDVTRGEDFSFLLVNRLLYENGNSNISIRNYEQRYRAFFVPKTELTIIHKPPYEAKKEYLFYLEKNLIRFIYDWGRYTSQKGLNSEKLEELSCYMSNMIDCEDMGEKIHEILNELENEYTKKAIDELKNKLDNIVGKVKKQNLFDEFLCRQKEYIELVNEIKIGTSIN